MKKKLNILERILAVCMVFLLCISIIPIVYAEDNISDSTIFDEGKDHIFFENWEYGEKTLKNGKTYAVLTGYLEENPKKITIPEEVNGIPVIGWGVYWDDELLKNSFSLTNPSRFSYEFLTLFLSMLNPFDTLRDYELVIPNSFPKNLVQAWRSSGKSEEDVALLLERFLNIEMYTCAANAFTVLPGNDYLQSVDGVLYADNMRVLLQYPVFKQSNIYELPNSVDLHAYIRNVTTFGHMNNSSGDQFLSPFSVFHLNEEEDEIIHYYPDNLIVHISEKQTNHTFRKLRKDYIRLFRINKSDIAALDFSIGIVLGFEGATQICLQSGNSLIHFHAWSLFPNTPPHLPKVDLCYGHDNTPGSAMFKVRSFFERLYYAGIVMILYYR